MIVGVCSACSGNIVQEECWEFAPGYSMMNAIIGPGGEDSHVKTTSIWCDDCGIKYVHLPKKKKDDQPKA